MKPTFTTLRSCVEFSFKAVHLYWNLFSCLFIYLFMGVIGLCYIVHTGLELSSVAQVGTQYPRGENSPARTEQQTSSLGLLQLLVGLGRYIFAMYRSLRSPNRRMSTSGLCGQCRGPAYRNPYRGAVDPLSSHQLYKCPALYYQMQWTWRTQSTKKTKTCDLDP